MMELFRQEKANLFFVLAMLLMLFVGAKMLAFVSDTNMSERQAMYNAAVQTDAEIFGGSDSDTQ